MDPNRSKLVISLAWILFWALMILVAVEDYQRHGGQALWHPILWEGSSALVSTLLLLAQSRFTRDEHLIATPVRWFAMRSLWLPVWWICFTPLAYGLRNGVYALAGETYMHDPWPRAFFYESLKISVFIGLFTVIHFGILSYRELLGARLRAEQANAQLRQAQLQRLAQQMQPHFLFNALNTVSSLMHSDVDKADATLVALGDVLRTTLAAGDAHEAPLDNELRLARGYGDVMEARFAGRVAIGWRIDEDAMKATLPVMSLQPLIENVFKHTVERTSEPTRIEVSAAREAGTLVVKVEDDQGTLAPGEMQGIGLKNLRERIKALYGERASLTLHQLSPAGVCSEMRIPCAS
ncbi:sensor histidine kinase [Massilia horti]|uniref:Sensor histidine kinase n=1 Tax=Massilia horti TaxID=2562153 RepID=A0A4Y9SYE7_9BURK|nr:histidine kinase [Massilia horti]TFW31674.1 sensor histidine kinase [Massilia horti]